MKLKLLTMLAGCLLAASSSGSVFPDDWDDEFKDAALFLPVGTDWRLLKAQCFQESRLNPLARSPVGAMGLCQFMPGTWRDMQGKHSNLTSVWIPELSIIAAALYMNQLNKFWSAPRPAMDRYFLALASYNAGAGHLVKAQRLADGAPLYKDIIANLPAITGRHSKETRDYVTKIVTRWWPIMILE